MNYLCSTAAVAADTLSLLHKILYAYIMYLEKKNCEKQVKLGCAATRNFICRILIIAHCAVSSLLYVPQRGAHCLQSELIYMMCLFAIWRVYLQGEPLCAGQVLFVSATDKTALRTQRTESFKRAENRSLRFQASAPLQALFCL